MSASLFSHDPDESSLERAVQQEMERRPLPTRRPPPTPGLEPREQRGWQRFPARWPVLVVTGSGEIVTHSRDISLHGICIDCPHALHPGQRVTLRIFAPKNVTDVEAEVRNVRNARKEHPALAGLSFAQALPITAMHPA